MTEEPLLDGEAAAVAAEVASGAQHSVAWHDDRYGVGGHGGADRPARTGTAGGHGEVLVRDGLAVVDLAEEALEHLAPEPTGQAPVERQVEAVPLTLEVLVELAPGRVGRGAARGATRGEMSSAR